MYKNNFSYNLKSLRIKNNLTQNELADALNISQGAYAKYESGKREPGFDTLLKISNYFNVSIDLLLNNSIEKKIDYILSSKLDYDINKDLSNALDLIEKLNNKKLYYLKKRKTLENIIEKYIPEKINEIDSLVEYLKLYENDKNINIDNTKEDTENFNEEYADELVPNITDINSYRKTKDEIVEDTEEEIEYRHIIDHGCVPAGKLRETFADDFGTFEVPENKLSRKKDYYILTISGDSMDKCYPDGEKILVENTEDVTYGDIVIARVSDSATVKKLSKHEKGIELVPLSNNPEHKPQIITDEDFRIKGKVLGLLSEFLD